MSNAFDKSKEVSQTSNDTLKIQYLIERSWLMQTLHKKWSVPLQTSSVNRINADLVTFTEEIDNGKLHFLFSEESFDLKPDWGLLRKLFYFINSKIISKVSISENLEHIVWENKGR